MLISRRDLLMSGLVAAGTSLPLARSWAGKKNRGAHILDEPDIVIRLSARPKIIDVGVGSESEFWIYRGELLKGPAEALIQNLESYLGPTITVHTGDRIRLIFENQLPMESVIHWHGLDVSHENDGHPHNAISPGESYEYDFVVENRAGMYWYHPHPHGNTGLQVYRGLAGLFVVKDGEEQTLNLPSGDQEMQVVLQDRYFNEDGFMEYRPSMMGAFGNRLLINGTLDRKKIVRKGVYRLRLLNGCNARIFNMALSHGRKLRLIGSDGGLLKKPVDKSRFYFAPAERVDLLVDFRDFNSGDVVTLESLPLVEGRGEKYSLIEFHIKDEAGRDYNCPEQLSEYENIPRSEARNGHAPKPFELIPVRGVGWTINGNAYEPDRYEDYELIPFGSTEVWEFYNPTGMPHPMHIHGTQFQVLRREIGSFPGCLDEGWKDTVLVMPGDRVQMIKRFNTFKGTFLYHCHNLEHEDMSMMRNFKITD